MRRCRPGLLLLLLLLAGSGWQQAPGAAAAAEQAVAGAASNGGASAAGGAAPALRPLEPWLDDDWKMNRMMASLSNECIVLKAASHGLGSNLHLTWWAATLLRHFKPSVPIYYSHEESLYQCVADAPVPPWFEPQPDAPIKLAPAPPGCQPFGFHNFTRMVRHVANHRWKPLQVSLMSQQHPRKVESEVQRSLLHRAVVQALCVAVRGWWHLSPTVQSEAAELKRQLGNGLLPVVALHARGGDKGTELPRAVLRVMRTSGTRSFPMQPGMLQLLERYPSLREEGVVCLIVGDDARVAKIVRAEALRVLGCKSVVMRAPQGGRHAQVAFPLLTLGERCEAMKRMLVDFELLAWASHLVGNPWSNVESVALLLRKCIYAHDDTTTVDGSGSFPNSIPFMHG